MEHALRGHTGEVRSITFSRDGLTLASGGADRIVKLWDPRTGHDLLSLIGHAATVTSVAFANDNRSLVTADISGAIYRWSVDDEVVPIDRQLEIRP